MISNKYKIPKRYSNFGLRKRFDCFKSNLNDYPNQLNNVLDKQVLINEINIVNKLINNEKGRDAAVSLNAFVIIMVIVVGGIISQVKKYHILVIVFIGLFILFLISYILVVLFYIKKNLFKLDQDLIRLESKYKNNGITISIKRKNGFRRYSIDFKGYVYYNSNIISTNSTPMMFNKLSNEKQPLLNNNNNNK